MLMISQACAAFPLGGGWRRLHSLVKVKADGGKRRLSCILFFLTKNSENLTKEKAMPSCCFSLNGQFLSCWVAVSFILQSVSYQIGLQHDSFYQAK